jgi:hypothetical protein
MQIAQSRVFYNKTMWQRFFCHSSLVPLLMCSLFVGSLLYADELSLDKAIVIVKNAERQVSTLEWSANITHTFSPPISSQAKKSVELESVTGLYDFNSKRYRVEFTRTVQTSTVEAVNAPYSIGLSYDGKTYCTLQGRKLENNKYDGNGIITEKIKDAWHHDTNIQKNRLRRLGLVTGLPGAIFSYIVNEGNYDDVRLSGTLVKWAKNAIKVSVNVENSGNYIHFLAEEPTFIENTILRTSIFFDIKRGAISEMELSHVKATDVVPYCKWEVEFVDDKKDGNISLPRRIVYQDYANYSKYVFEYKTVIVNPERTSKDYLCEMPNGVTVEDAVNNLFYKVGDPVDEDKAIERFMTLHGLTGNVPSKTTLGGIIRYVLIGAGCLLIIIALILKILEYRGRKQ